MRDSKDDAGWGGDQENEFGETGERLDDIQTLLELGYEQLDGFRNWVEESLNLGARIAEQDCFNAETLIDFLANIQQKSVTDMDEYDLRWFVFSHYIRKAMADPETEERLLESLDRFFEYLRNESRELVPEWVQGVVEDATFYHRRREAFASLNNEDEATWKIGFREWCQELESDLDTRSLWLPREIGDGLEWGDAMGWREATLYSEANRAWQRERERMLGQGFMGEALRIRLYDVYAAWLDTPQGRLEDQTPFEVIQLERLANLEHLEEEDDSLDDE